MQEGGCLCGAVRYAVSGQPTDVICCHCRFCQRATGSAYNVETLFPKEALRLIAGAPAIHDHVSGGSGKVIHIHFCGGCGTKLYMTFERFPAIAGVFSGTFDDPNWFDRTPSNTLHFFLGTAQDGTVIPAGVEVYHAHYWHSEGVPNVPQVFDAPAVVTPELRRASADFAARHSGGKPR